MSILNSKIPEGPIGQKWSNHKAKIKVVSPNNKRKLEVIVIGTGLAGASAAASLSELGYNSMIPSRVVTTAHARQTFTALQKSLQI